MKKKIQISFVVMEGSINFSLVLVFITRRVYALLKSKFSFGFNKIKQYWVPYRLALLPGNKTIYRQSECANTEKITGASYITLVI